MYKECQCSHGVLDDGVCYLKCSVLPVDTFLQSASWLSRSSIAVKSCEGKEFLLRQFPAPCISAGHVHYRRKMSSNIRHDYVIKIKCLAFIGNIGPLRQSHSLRWWRFCWRAMAKFANARKRPITTRAPRLNNLSIMIKISSSILSSPQLSVEVT